MQSEEHEAFVRPERQDQDERRPDQADGRVDDATDGQRDRVGSHALLDGLDRVARCRVQVPIGRARHERAVDEAGQGVLVDVLPDEPRPAVQAHLAVDEVRLEPDQQHQAVVEAGPPDAPLVDEGGCLRQVLVLGDARVHLDVDHDLGPGLCLDGIDARLEVRDRLRFQHAGLVIHATFRHRVGERGAGGGHGRDERDHEQRGSSERPEPCVHDAQDSLWHPSCDNPRRSGRPFIPRWLLCHAPPPPSAPTCVPRCANPPWSTIS